MNHLLAKLKGKNSQYWKVITRDEDIFDLPDFSTNHNFCPNHKLDDGEWHKIDTFSTQGFSNELVGNSFNSTNYNQLLPENYKDISYFCCKQGNYFLFQRMAASQILKKKWFRISEAPALEEDSPIITLNPFLDAVYDSSTDTLYFRDFAKLKVIFDGIESLYRDATQVEVESFLSNDFISLADDYSADRVKTANRKRIALVMDKLQQYSETEQQQIFEYIRPYCPHISANDNTFQISSEEELKLLLFGIEQRYFTTPIGNEKRLANSIQIIDSNAV